MRTTQQDALPGRESATGYYISERRVAMNFRWTTVASQAERHKVAWQVAEAVAGSGRKESCW